MKKIGLFFGAGAETSYGMPSGGKFALELFRQDNKEVKTLLKQQIESINSGSRYARDWLPSNYDNNRIMVFGKPDYRSLIGSSLEYRRNEIIKYFQGFDKKAESCLRDDLVEIGVEQIKEAYKNLTSESWGEHVFSHEIKFHSTLNAPNIFNSEYLSALLRILQKTKVTEENKNDILPLKKCVTAMLQLIVGGCAQNLANTLNSSLFEKAPDDIDIFDDLSGLFTIDFDKAGLSALEIVLEWAPSRLTESDLVSPAAVFHKFAAIILQDIVSVSLDYQELLDKHYRFLYSPKADWAKFCKVVSFLHAVRLYMSKKEEQCLQSILDGDGYYKDLMKFDQIDVCACGTSNYTSLLKAVVNKSERLKGLVVEHLNGSLVDYYDPYLNKIVPESKDSEGIDSHVLVPFLFTQSGLKPLTSVEMSKRYVNLHQSYSLCEAVVIIGFGFNGDDGHINGLFRDLADEQDKTIVVLAYGYNDAADAKSDFSSKLRVSKSDNIHVWPVDHERKVNGKLWVDALQELLSSKG
jgi:hypothetical protein